MCTLICVYSYSYNGKWNNDVVEKDQELENVHDSDSESESEAAALIKVSRLIMSINQSNGAQHQYRFLKLRGRDFFGVPKTED